MNCPNCNSTNVTIQALNEVKLKTKHHGIIWWLLVGWWWVPIKWFVFFVPALIFKVFGIGKKYKAVNKTVKKGVCQNCGHIFDI